MNRAEIDELLTNFSDPIRDLAAVFFDRFGERLTFAGMGRYKAAFEYRGVILKLPLSIDGAIDMSAEFRAFAANPEISPRFRRSKFGDLPVAIVEKLDTSWMQDSERAAQIRKENDWVFGIDCFQVGHDRHGELKVYDF